jgi:hypothetical protein
MVIPHKSRNSVRTVLADLEEICDIWTIAGINRRLFVWNPTDAQTRALSDVWTQA